ADLDAVDGHVVAVLLAAADLDAGRPVGRGDLLEGDGDRPAALDVGHVQLVAGVDDGQPVAVAGRLLLDRGAADQGAVEVDLGAARRALDDEAIGRIGGEVAGSFAGGLVGAGVLLGAGGGRRIRRARAARGGGGGGAR